MFAARRALAISFRFVAPWVALAATPFALLAQQNSGAAPPAGAAAAQQPNDQVFAVPDGTPADLLNFIERIAKPNQRFTNGEEVRQYRNRASTAIAAAAEKILAGKSTDEQATDAIGWKMQAFQIQEQLGNREADQDAEKFLNDFKSDPRVSVARAARQMSFLRKMRKWQQLDPAERADVLKTFVVDLKAGGMGHELAWLAIQVCDDLSNGPDQALAAQAFNELLPLYQESNDPNVAKMLPMAEGLARRINLLGNPIEMAGTLMDGSELDWDSYRGKVVLIDFWATWCGPCRAELPNVIENYRAYHDKGFEVIGVCLDTDRNQVEQFLHDTGVDWPTLFNDAPDAERFGHPMAEKCAITGISRAILVDQQGNVVSMMARGPLLRNELQKLLGEPSPAHNSATAPPDEPKTARRVSP